MSLEVSYLDASSPFIEVNKDSRYSFSMSCTGLISMESWLLDLRCLNLSGMCYAFTYSYNCHF